MHQEFDNAEGEDYQADVSALASPASQNGPEVYVLPLTEVSLPVSKQPGRSSKKSQIAPAFILQKKKPFFPFSHHPFSAGHLHTRKSTKMKDGLSVKTAPAFTSASHRRLI